MSSNFDEEIFWSLKGVIFTQYRSNFFFCRYLKIELQDWIWTEEEAETFDCELVRLGVLTGGEIERIQWRVTGISEQGDFEGTRVMLVLAL